METLREIDESERLQALSRYEILDTPPEPVFDDLAELASNILDAPISVISFLDRHREWFKSHIGLPLNEISRDHGFSSYTIQNDGLFVVPDAMQDERFSHDPLVAGDLKIRFYAGCPLLSRTGVHLGTLSVLDRVPHELSSNQRDALQMLSREATLLLELRREILENQHRNELLSSELAVLRERFSAELMERRHSEEILRKRERQLADAQHLAHLGSWEWDFKEQTVAWSDELYRIFGAKPGEFPVTFESYIARVHPEDREKARETIEAAARTAGKFTSENRIIRADGEERVLDSQGEVMFENEGPARMVGSCLDVTERKKMKSALEQSLSLLQATLESTADGILVVDLKGHLVRCNQKFLEMWRLPPDLLKAYDDTRAIEMAVAQLINRGDYLEKVHYLYAHPEEESLDILEFKDGRTFQRFSQPQRLDGKIIGRVWSFSDVTQRCRALNILRQSEERFRSLVIATAQVVWATDRQGDILEDSLTWRQFTGQTKEEILATGWLNAIHPDDRERIAESWRQCVASRCLYEAEARVRRNDGEWRDLNLRGVPVFESSGELREWVGFGLDVTEQRRAERTIISERDFSDAIINSLPGIFYLLDETGLNLRWNKNLEQVTEYSADEIRKMRASDFVEPAQREMLAERIHKVFVLGQADIELTLISKSGRRIPFFCTGKLVDFHGKPRLIGMGIDLSERVKAEEEVKKINQELEERVSSRTLQLNASNKDLQSFSYTVSHDLKAPLRAIRGFAQALDEDCGAQLNDEHRLYLKRISQAADRMTQLIEDLLTYSRIGRTAVQFHPVPLQSLIQGIVNDYALRIHREGGTISIAADFPVINTDSTLLNQVFSNIFENAIIYRSPDRPIRIDVNWRSKNGAIIICIQDNGIGIAPEHHQKIFEVFQRLHTSQEIPGTGIGLANVKKAIEMLGGKIWVESEPGKGSTFCIQLKRT